MNSKYSWRCPSCHKQPKTLSFRASNHTNPLFMISNSAYLDTAEPSQSDIIQPVDQLDTVEVMIQELKSSERLLFDPKGATSPLLQEVCSNNNYDGNEGLRYHQDENGRARFALEENAALVTVDSKDPFVDFRESMKEMMEAHDDELRDWEDLEELLSLYLRFNGKNTHGYIIAAFLDLVLRNDEDDDDVDDEDDDVLERPGGTSCSCSVHQDSHPCTSYSSNLSSCDESLS